MNAYLIAAAAASVLIARELARDLEQAAADSDYLPARTWDGLVSKLGRGALPDFGPDAQDRAALELIRERGALADVRSGRLTDAVSKVRKVWASLPGANYQGQGMRSMSYLQTAYRNAGGTITL